MCLAANFKMEAMKYSGLKNAPQGQVEMLQSLEVVFLSLQPEANELTLSFSHSENGDIYFIDLLGRLTEVLARKQPAPDTQ